jgi:hypothetical protein
MPSVETTEHVPHTHPRFQEAYGLAWSGTEDAPLLRYFAEKGEYTDTGSSITVRGHSGIVSFRRAMFAFSPDSRIVFTSLLCGAGGFAAVGVALGGPSTGARATSSSSRQLGPKRREIPRGSAERCGRRAAVTEEEGSR